MRTIALRPIEAMSHHVRLATRVHPGRPALWMGLRMAAAMSVPLLLTSTLAPATATAASLAGYMITLVDKGGAYRTRATAMAAASVLGLVAVIIGVSVAHTPLAAPTVIAGFTIAALAHHWGMRGVSIATPAVILLALASFRNDTTTLADVLAGTALGAAWAMVLALILWPVRVYRPGRQAIANVLGELANLASAIVDHANGHVDRLALLARHRRIRADLEAARETLVAIRRARDERQRGEILLALVHACDRMFGNLVAIEAAVDASDADVQREVRQLQDHPAIYSRLADLVLDETPPEELHAEIKKLLAAAESKQSIEARVPLLFHHHATGLRHAYELIASLSGRTTPITSELPIPDMRPRLREQLREIFDLDSAVLRHALRVLITTTLASIIAAAIHSPFSYWILLTVFLLLQPQRASTTARAIQRVVGTTAGALIAAAVVVLIPDQRVLVVITVVFAALGASVLQLNYGLFSLFVTPTFVLLTELQTHDFDLVGIRILYTLLGGAIAFLAGALLWPSRERDVFESLLARALTCAAAYVAAVRHAVETGAPVPSADVIRARRAFGMALGNAEVGLDRLAAERAPVDVVEPYMSAVAAARRLAGSINVLGVSRMLAPTAAEPAVAERAAAAEARLHALATTAPTTTIAAGIDAIRDEIEAARPLS